jgi:hypothetical protein
MWSSRTGWRPGIGRAAGRVAFHASSLRCKKHHALSRPDSLLPGEEVRRGAFCAAGLTRDCSTRSLASSCSNMHASYTVLSRWSRGGAALVLVMWVAAQVLCFAHCHFPSAKKSTVAHHQGSCCPKKTEKSGSTVCVTLKSALHDLAAPSAAAPSAPLLYLLVAWMDTPAAPALSAAQNFLRQQCSRDRLRTPEVCLGPAFRSHAPPVLA